MRLINADALMKDIDNDIFCTESRKCYEKMRVRKQPTIDAEPVRHGRWIRRITVHGNSVIPSILAMCSECKTDGSPMWKRCPVCEAKMDGKKEGNSDEQ